MASAIWDGECCMQVGEGVCHLFGKNDVAWVVAVECGWLMLMFHKHVHVMLNCHSRW